MKWNTPVFRRFLAVVLGLLAPFVAGPASGFAAPALSVTSVSIDAGAAADDAYLVTAVVFVSVLTVVVLALVGIAWLTQRRFPGTSGIRKGGFMAHVLGFPEQQEVDWNASGVDIDLTPTAAHGVAGAVLGSSARRGQPYSGYWAGDSGSSTS